MARLTIETDEGEKREREGGKWEAKIRSCAQFVPPPNPPLLSWDLSMKSLFLKLECDERNTDLISKRAGGGQCM